MRTSETIQNPVGEREVEVVEDRVSPATRIGQVMVAGSGVVLAVSGVMTLVSTGIHKNLAQPVVEMWGHTHTPWLGIVELVVGIVLIGLGTSIVSRRSAVVIGVLLIAAGVFAIADPMDAPTELAIDTTYGWIPLALGVVVTVGSLLPDNLVRVRSHRIERI
jgi:hypothetical protein